MLGVQRTVIEWLFRALSNGGTFRVRRCWEQGAPASPHFNFFCVQRVLDKGMGPGNGNRIATSTAPFTARHTHLWMNIALWVLPIPLCRLALLGVRWQRVWR